MKKVGNSMLAALLMIAAGALADGGDSTGLDGMPGAGNLLVISGSAH